MINSCFSIFNIITSVHRVAAEIYLDVEKIWYFLHLQHCYTAKARVNHGRWEHPGLQRMTSPVSPITVPCMHAHMKNNNNSMRKKY